LAEIVPVVSDTLEAQIRNLLPSQRGFGEDLQASNVITPIIDLTSAAQGTSTPEILQTALAFGSQTSFSLSNSTATLANSPGFWRITATVASIAQSGSTNNGDFSITDGLATKKLYEMIIQAGASAGATSLNYDFVVFLRAGDSVSATSGDSSFKITGSYRQIADVNGTFINPVGFSPQ
jgi:hypothetical protein